MPTGDTEADKKTAVSIRDYQMMKARNKKLDNIVQTFTSENEDVQKKFIEEFENLGMEASDIFQYDSKQNGKTSLASFFENPLNEAKESLNLRINDLIEEKINQVKLRIAADLYEEIGVNVCLEEGSIHVP
jgi:DNA anti-recombination protein RmuC